jgi:hypothetical protein
MSEEASTGSPPEFRADAVSGKTGKNSANIAGINMK